MRHLAVITLLVAAPLAHATPGDEKTKPQPQVPITLDDQPVSGRVQAPSVQVIAPKSDTAPPLEPPKRKAGNVGEQLPLPDDSTR
jgi:hypothetical protein